MIPDDHRLTLDELKAQIRSARTVAQRRVDTALIELSRATGATPSQRQASGIWGRDVLGQVADDLRAEFPEMTGFSRSSSKYRRAFAQARPPAGREATAGG